MLKYALIQLLLALTAHAGAQTMSFEWRASHGARVHPGDVVKMELIASWTPHLMGFAGSRFSIYDETGGNALFGAGSRVWTERSITLEIGDGPVARDSDGDGQIDVLDDVNLFQSPPFFNPGFDFTHPLTLLTVFWKVGEDASGPVRLRCGPTLDDRVFTADVYTDTFGSSQSLARQDSTIRFVVPSPAAMGPILGVAVLAVRRIRKP